MKKSKFGRRVVALVLVMIMVASILPLSAFAVNKFDVVTDRNVTYTGIDNSSLNQNGTINWPIKIYDYLADGLLFEYAQADGKVMYSSNKVNTDDYTGQYVLGRPMPPTPIGHDFTNDYVYTGQQVNIGYSAEDYRYVKKKMPAVDYQNPQYMRITPTGTYLSNFSTNMNCCITNFTSDNGGDKAKASVRYVTMVYRAGGIANSGTVPGFAMNIIGSSGSWLRFPANDANLYDIYGNTMTNTSEWKVFVADLATLHPGNWSSLGNNLSTVYLRLVQNSMSDYFDISHIGYFSTADAAKQFGEQCLAFIKEPGEYIAGTYWNGAGNDGFGMLYPSNGAAWNSGGGNPITSTTGGQYAGYYTQGIGAVPSKYESAWTFGTNINKNRKDGVDSDGRLNGTGNLIGTSDMIYLIQPKTFMNVTGGTEYDMSELQFDGYNLLTKSTKGVFTAGLLEGSLGADGTPQYRQETVEYIADLLSKTLTIPRTASNGYNNYNFVAGVKNRAQYGYTIVDGKEVANDLAQGLRNCLGIYFSGNNKAAAPKMGTYAETLQKAANLKGAFLTVYPNIKTCMDAAYYLLNNLFVANSYNQAQNDYRYLTLSSAKLSNGKDAYVFDGGFSNGASLDKVANGSMTQQQYNDASNSAIEYSSLKKGGDGTISINKVDEKDYFYYQANEGSYTTMYPFLPVTDATGVYAGGTDSYYFAEDGKRSYTDEFGTYKNRNYNYVLASNGEFVYHEEDSLFFEFEGDDDVYLFINGQLVLDLGGGHSVASSTLNVNDYVVWAREVLKNPANYSEEEVTRAQALDLTNGEIASFDFYYMERHGYGANMRIATNMRITDPALRVEKTAYQGGKQIEYGGIVDADDPIEYNFKISNVGNTKLYNLTFDDADIGVSLTPEKGLFVVGDDTATELDNINGYYVTDARGERLDAEDLTAIVSGYQNVGTGGNYIQSGHTYTKVADGAGTHIYYEGNTVKFADNEALKTFLKDLQSNNTDGSSVNDELTQQGSGLWVDADVTFKGIYYTMTKEQDEAGMFDNTVQVTATTRIDPNDAASETLRSEARHRVYVTAIPSYYQWADHDLFISKKRLLDDSSAEAGNESSLLHDYVAFFNTVSGDIGKFGTKLCDRMGNAVADGYYPYVELGYQAADGNYGYKTCYPESGIYEFFVLMYLYGKSGEVKTMNLGEYAIVRVLIIVTDVEDSEYVLDYGLSTENLDSKGELFKNDELYGSLSGTQALLMGVTNKQPSYMNVKDRGTDFNRINFDALNLSENNKVMTDAGYYSVNIHIPEEGKKINYDEFSGLYTLTETGTVTVHVECPVAWENLYLYYWYDDGANNIWPGEPMSRNAYGDFELAIPSNVPHVIISNGTNQTVDLNLNTGQEAWINVPGTANDAGKLYATVEYKTADGIVHVSVPDGWGDVYYYCWDAFEHGLVSWPGTKVTEVDADGYYTFTIPGDITDIVINNGDNGKKTIDQVVFAGTETWLTVNDKIMDTDSDGVDYYGATSSRSTETVTMHASVPNTWAGASIYYWNSNGSSTGVNWPGIAMTKGDDGLYHIEGIPADVTNVIINDGRTEKAEQTHNLRITPGVETWFDVSVKSGESNTEIKAEVPSSWSTAYVYFFDNNYTTVGSAWPGSVATKGSDGRYTINVPNNAEYYVVNNGSGEQTQDMRVIRGATNEIIVRGNMYATSNKDTELHIEAPTTWSDVYVHYWYTVGEEDIPATPWPGVKATKNSDSTYSFTIPAGYTKFIINNGAGTQTANITDFYMGIENHIQVYDNASYRLGMPYETDIVYGENAEKEGFTFTPTDFMDSVYSIWLAVTVHESKVDDEEQGSLSTVKPTALGKPINIAKEVQMYKKVSVLPATVVYYEDDFAGIKYNTDSTANVFDYFGNGSGSLSQSIDQNQAYGQDSAYQGSENDEITGDSLTRVEIKDTQDIASFEFKGTGFEIIGHTHAVSPGTLKVTVKDENGQVVSEKMVITEFDQGADGGEESVSHVPIIRFSGLDYGNYTVYLSGVPVIDWDKFNGDISNGIPVKEARVCIDGIRIYQPLDSSTDGSENVALGKKYEVNSYSGSPYTAKLTDGKAEKTLQSGVNDSAWFGFKNTGNSSTGNVDPNNSNRVIAVVDLGEVCQVEQVRVHQFAGTNSVGASSFEYINVYYSQDGNSYSYAQTINPDATQMSSYWATLDIAAALGAPVNARYIKLALSTSAGKMFLLNEIEVYGKAAPQAGKNDSYLDTENAASFTEIRNLIAERQAFAVKYDDTEGLSVSGGTNTWIENRNNVLPTNRDKSWKNNNVNSVADYLLAGPNNEVYMIESTQKEKSALVFYVTETEVETARTMQVGIRALDYGAYVDAEEIGYINAEIQYGAMVDGELVWKPLTTIKTTAEQYYTIPYTECPYDAENDRYQVVLRVADTDVTGMASYTTIKLKGLELNMLNTSEVPDVPELSYKDEINNTIIDSNGNTLDTSKFVNFIQLSTQMQSEVVMYNTGDGQAAKVVGVDTSALGVLYDSFTADNNSNFGLTTDSRIYIVSASESTKPSAETIETAQLVQSQLVADERPSSAPLEIVWGLEKYSRAGDIIIYANASGYGAEEFKLVVTDRAKVYASDDSGLLYGLNTLQKHFRNAKSNAIKGFTVQDKPDTKERAVHLDCARKYLTDEYIKNFIAEMSWMGYNALELHFSEDGGFRIDFWGNQALSEVPGMTGNDFSWVCGSNPAPWVYTQFQDTADKGKYLSTEEIIGICQTAKQYNIEIIPSFDTPAHVGYMTELYYNTVKSNSNSSIRNFTYNGTKYTLPTQINYREYTGSSDSRYDFSVLDLSNTAVKNFAYAMYSDMAAFFKYYAGSTDFNIGADEVTLDASVDRWTYTDFINYTNNVNAVLKSYGYTTRMYNDFVDNTKYSSTAKIDGDIEIVYWDAPSITTSNSTENIRRASYFYSTQDRVVYSGVQNWTYYVLRIAPTSTATHMDARDPDNRQWTFYRNQEDLAYQEWNPTLLSEYTLTYAGIKHGHYRETYAGENLGGGYFMVWNDFPGLNTEVEVWNGCTDLYGKYSSSAGYSGYGYNYSLIERMWSNAVKQWNWDIHNTLTFANYETLRDSMGYFPGYVSTPSTKAYANGFTLAEPTAVSDVPFRDSFTVTFVNYDGTVLETQEVREGSAATAPQAPTRPSDVWYDYTFSGWDKDFSNVTTDIVVTATYSGSATTAGRIGYLEVKVSGGTNFNMSINGSNTKPMGIEYVNPAMEFGASVTVTAETTNGNKFIGWMDAKNGEIVSTARTYTFNTSGNDVLAALYDADLVDGGLVIFRNDKNNQVIDIQYYASTDTIVFPDATSYPGYEFVGWNLSEESIKSMLSEGKDVTVLPTWRNEDVYFSIVVNGGEVTDSPAEDGGKYVGYKGTTITATPQDGKIFAYWADEDGNVLSYDKEYKFYPYRDIEITAHYIVPTDFEVKAEGTMTNEPAEKAQAKTFTVYFENNWKWTDVSAYYWGVEGEPSWPGISMTLVENNGTNDIYMAEIPYGVKGVVINGIKNDGSGDRDQTPDIKTYVDGRQYSMNWNYGNEAVVNDYRINGSTQFNTTYLYVSEDWKASDAWFAVRAWDGNNTSDVAWYRMEHINGNVYAVKTPVKYGAFVFARMNPASNELSQSNQWNESVGLTVTPDDTDNMYVLNDGWNGDGTIANMNTVYFVNDWALEDVKVSYTDARGTFNVELVCIGKDENGKDVYSMLIPNKVQKVTFTVGSKSFDYTVTSTLARNIVFTLDALETQSDKDVLVNVGMDTTSKLDNNTVVFSWDVSEETYTFVNAGLLLVREEDYNESTFVKGTMDLDVIQFTPARKYQTATGIHSITIPQVAVGDSWVACAFVQYRDEQGILRTKYSKQVTGKK